MALNQWTLVALGIAILIFLIWGQHRIRLSASERSWLPKELRDAELVYAERVFRSGGEVPIVAKCDRAYRVRKEEIVLVELKTRRWNRPYLSDVIELSAQRFAIQMQTGECVAGYRSNKTPMRRPVRFSASTVTATYVAVSLVVLILFAAPVLYAWNTIVEERSTERLGEDAHRLSNVFMNHGANALNTVIDAMVEAQPEGDEKFILLTDPALHVIEGNLPAWPANLPTAPGTYNLSFPLRGRLIDATIVRAQLPNGDHLLVGRNGAKFQSAKALFWVGLIGAAGAVLLFGLSGGMLIRAALLAEVQRISKTAAAIAAGDLSRRLPTHGETNELDMLAQTVNRMLDQIEHLIRGVRNVSNAVAHDLRTPLTELRTRLEELSWTCSPAGGVATAVESAVVDIDRIIAIFNALLRLAEIDNGVRRSGFVVVDLKKLAEDAVDFYQPLAEVKGLVLTFAGSREQVHAADPLLLAQAVGNLIDNALKFARSSVRVTLLRDQNLGRVTLSVVDDGPGISEEEKDKVTERFYRGDSSRGTPGVGLGLSLVVAVAKLHGGNLELLDAHPGLQANMHV